jgi:hypothetical protein
MRSVGRITRLQEEAWPVARWILKLGGVPGGDQREEVAGEQLMGAGVEGEEVSRSPPSRALNWIFGNCPGQSL